MREIVLGTAGHVDHGKTSLVRALTGIDTDRLKEEKERGITIELGFAFIDLPSGHRLGIVDVPGHEKFIRNMVAGASGMDLVAFIVAADEGIMPQTREHFDICRLLGIKRGLIIITKKDMVEPDWLELVKEETREFFSETFLHDAPMLTVSSITGEGIDAVKTILDNLVTSTDFTEAHGPFRLPVDRVFTMKGFGVVVTGTSLSGRISVGDEIVIYPQEQPGKIRGIQVHARDVNEVEAGHRTAINIQGLDKELVNRGDVIATAGCLESSYLFDADFFYLSGNKKPLKNRSRVRIHIGTAEILGRVVLLDDEELPPGNQANVQLLFEEPVGVWPGDRYVIRSYSPVTTIGGGEILGNSPRKRRRFKEGNKASFAKYHSKDPEVLALLHLSESGHRGLTFTQLAVRMGLFGNRLKKVLNNPLSSQLILIVDQEKQRMIAADVYEKLSAQALGLIAQHHEKNPLKAGLAKEELRSKLRLENDQRLFQYLIGQLIKRKKIEQDESLVRLPGHKVALAADEQNLRRDLEKYYLDSGLAPPTMKEVLDRFSANTSQQINDIIAVLAADQFLIRVTEGLYFNANALAALKDKMVAAIKKDGDIDAPRFKELTGLSRKFTIPLLEYFDRIKVTIRVGDKRILRE